MRRNVGRQRRKLARPVAFLHIISTSRLLEVLREDNRAIVRAASAASKAADYLLAFRSEPDDSAEVSAPDQLHASDQAIDLG
jgi:antirestriction protein ArdC